MKHALLTLTLLGLVMGLVGCGAEAPTATPLPPTATPAAPVATATPVKPAEPTNTPTPAAMPTDEKVIRDGIQKVLDARLKALDKGDEAAFMATIDQGNLTWKRVQNEFFNSEAFGKRFRGQAGSGKVTKVKIHRPNYVKAWLTLTYGGGQDWVWVYKWVDGKWLHSEPEEDELGERLIYEGEAYQIKYWEWDKEIIEQVNDIVKKGYQWASSRSKRQPKEKFLVVLSPTYQSAPGRGGASTGASFISGLGLSIRSLESFGAWWTPTGEKWDDHLISNVAHETIHLLQHEFMYPRAMTDWLSEGLAYYLTDDIRPSVLREAIRANKVYTLKQLENIYGFEDDLLERYGFAQSTALVQYIIEKYGGVDTYWKLAGDYKETRSIPTSIQKVLGISSEQLEKDWQNWLRQKYG